MQAFWIKKMVVVAEDDIGRIRRRSSRSFSRIQFHFFGRSYFHLLSQTPVQTIAEVRTRRRSFISTESTNLFDHNELRLTL